MTALNKKLEQQLLTLDYANIIEEQKETGIIERVGESLAGTREFYIPHKLIVHAAAESAKVSIVYEASARAFDGSPSLKDCLHAGPPLQNKLWNVMVRGCFNPIALPDDLQKAFLQARIRESDQDAMHFHWR